MDEHRRSTDWVTQPQLDMVASFQRELRDGLHLRITTVAEMVTGLGEQMRDGFDRVTSRQDLANGRTTKTEEAIAAIRKSGCANYPKHVEVLAALSAAGVVPDSGVTPAVARSWTKHPATKVTLGGALVGAGAVLPHVWEGIHRLIHLLTGGAL